MSITIYKKNHTRPTHSDEIRPDILSHAHFILVDHHVPTPLTPLEQIDEIIDHRPLDLIAQPKMYRQCKVQWNKVGSCTTIIAQMINERQHWEQVRPILPFLRATIILDTVNFSATADKATPLDREMCDIIETKLAKNVTDRAHIFQELITARNNVAGLSLRQILYKDMKIYRSADGSKAIGLPGMPILIEVRRPDRLNEPDFGNNFFVANFILIGVFVF